MTGAISDLIRLEIGMRLLVLLLGLFSGLLAQAQDSSEIEQNIREGLQKIAPDMEISRIRPTDVEGLYEVVIGAEVIYMSADGRYLLRGDLLDLKEQRNVSDNVRSQARRELLADVSKDEMIRFSNGESKHVIHVFTDIDCGYCRKLHQDVSYLTEQGVEVRYLAYPRAGLDSDTSEMMEAVWCSSDRQAALTDAKSGKEIEAESCDNPVAEQYKMGQTMGIRGTPAIFLESGRQLPGYVPPKELLSILDSDS
ncbi:thiol:disulfide interchange protein DsbC [Methylohalomonas lacus]|uniref:Thiol:disulfide interchange protein n=1 Tax=Methylohalomonas lacus TaxID=398773 RepID=A0AAE3L236_9GAMM|nr:DsbC family protein [Methylohalomonas lacus]MCS3904450.1 thiol:disulfide interchange protein DsbC [Methylohalomonas lacus]